jgi:hypothetical protein
MSVFKSFRDSETRTADGAHRSSFLSPYAQHWDWGRIDLPDPVRTTRSGIARYRLAVYAPGTNDVERHELVVARRWWFADAWITVVAELALAASRVGFGTASVVGLAGLVTAWYWLARTRQIRQGTRTLQVAVVRLGPREVIGDAALFRECRRELVKMEESVRLGACTPTEREAIWATVYNRMAPHTRVLGNELS